MSTDKPKAQQMPSSLQAAAAAAQTLSSLQTAVVADPPEELTVAIDPTDGRPLQERDIASMIAKYAEQAKTDSNEIISQVRSHLPKGFNAQAFVDQFYSLLKVWSPEEQIDFVDDKEHDGWSDDEVEHTLDLLGGVNM